MNYSNPIIFDRSLLRHRQRRAAHQFPGTKALIEECALQLGERLSDVKRSFPSALDLSPLPFLTAHANQSVISASDIVFDEELLPFGAERFDLIVSNLQLHWVNDVPGCLSQIHSALKADGLFLASLIGEHSLHELRSCLFDAELAMTGGISPRLSPTIDLQSASALMQRAGYSLPVTDKETVTLIYSDMFSLMRDLRAMGQDNIHTGRLRVPTKKAVFLEAARLYKDRFGDENGHIPATFDIIYLHGWK